MKHLWVLLSLALIFASPIYAAIPAGKVQTSSPIESRWKEYAKDTTGTWYYDRQTIKPEVQDLLTSPTGTIPVVINGWTKIQFKNGTYSEPQRVYLDCRFKENLAPDSSSEKLYGALCLHPATLRAVSQAIEVKKAELTGNINSEMQRQRTQQDANDAQARQYQTQQVGSMVQNTLWQGAGLINSFRR